MGSHDTKRETSYFLCRVWNLEKVQIYVTKEVEDEAVVGDEVITCALNHFGSRP